MAEQTSKTVVVTGGTDGIGRATALGLARRKWRVVIIGRSAEKGAAVLGELAALHPAEHLFLPRDFSKMADAASAGGELRTRVGPLDALVHCAGIISSRLERTADGIEKNFAVNYLSRFLLTRTLVDRLVPRARVVNVAAAGFFGDFLDLQRLAAEKVPAADEKIFETSQFSNDLWAIELAARQPGWSVSAVNPGLVKTSIRQRSDSAHWYFKLMDPLTRMFGMTPEVGARTPVGLVDEPAGPERSGRFFGPKMKELKVPAAAKDPAKREALWKASQALIQPWA